MAQGSTRGHDLLAVNCVFRQIAADLGSHQQPVVLMTAFGSSSVDFEVSVWISDPWTLRRRSSDLHESIWWALKEKNVIIAFPQMDVHLDHHVVKSLEDLAAAG